MLKGVGENILDAYVQDFLDLPSNFDEKNLRKAIIENLKKFILIFGKDFTFLGEECHRHVGLKDYSSDFFSTIDPCLAWCPSNQRLARLGLNRSGR